MKRTASFSLTDADLQEISAKAREIEAQHPGLRISRSDALSAIIHERRGKPQVAA